MDNLPAPPNTLPGDFCKMTPGSFSMSEWFDLPIWVADVLHPTIGALSISTDAPSRHPRNLSAAISRLSGRFNRPLSPADTLSNVSAKVSGPTRTLSKAIYMLSAAYKSLSNPVNCAKNDSYALSSPSDRVAKAIYLPSDAANTLSSQPFTPFNPSKPAVSAKNQQKRTKHT